MYIYNLNINLSVSLLSLNILSMYKFVNEFNKNRYGQDKNHSCLLNVEIYTRKKVLKNKTLSQFPALISKTIIKYDQLSDFQRKNF